MPAQRARAALPAKLSPPQLHGTLVRERLLAWLDGQPASVAVWISGAPGAGKTTLAASYLLERGLTALWYRLDHDDNDVGVFFATLGRAVDRLAGRVPRPRFAAEHLHEPRSYARAWFRSVYAALPRPLVLVLDNLEQARLPALAGLLAEAIDELPAGVRLLVTCRHAPPAELAGATLRGVLVPLPAAALAFTSTEATGFAHTLGLDAATVRAAALRVHGWAAGLRLLSHAGTEPPRDAAPQLLFDYFAGLLHDRLDPPGQRLLLAAALLPWVPADLLAAVAEVPDAGERLEALCRHHLFTERVEALPGVYRLHPLLREFLQQRGRRSVAADALQRWQRAAAQGFAQRGEVDAAIDLHLDAGDSAGALPLLREALEARLAAGQLGQIAAWCTRLGEAALDAEPWLRYGLARACFLREDAAALDHYERAASAFAAQGDPAGRQLCAAGILEWRYNTDSFIDHARWSELLREPLPTQHAPAREEHALRLLNGRLLACFYRGDFAAEAGSAVDEVLQVLVPGTAENEKLSAAITLLGLLERHKRWDEAELLAARMEALLASPRVGPRMAILVRQQIAADLHRQCGNFDEARRLATASRTLAREQGFAVLEYEGAAVALLMALCTDDEEAARRGLAELATLSKGGDVYHQRFMHHVQAWHELQCGRVANARAHAEALRAAVARSDMPPRFRATWLLTAMLVRFADGDEAGAGAELASAVDLAEPGSRANLQVALLALQAWRALRDGDAEAAGTALHAAWPLAATVRHYQLLGPLRRPLAELAALALERGVLPAFTRELIRRRRLQPASAAVPHWPWPVVVRTLGAFAIEVDGAPLRFSGKLPRKPLALLKALIALGPQPVAEATLADALWPDEDADAAHAALTTALHRLRRLLPQGIEALPLQDGRLALDPRLVWVDCRAFEKLAVDAEQPGPARLPALQRALALYRGRFLAAETDEPWAVSARERLRARCRRVVGACAAALAEAGQHDAALDCWQRGIEIDDLDEAFHQGVMACALRLARPAEGLAAYQRCRRTLSLTLGIAPSAATEELARRLRSIG